MWSEKPQDACSAGILRLFLVKLDTSRNKYGRRVRLALAFLFFPQALPCHLYAPARSYVYNRFLLPFALLCELRCAAPRANNIYHRERLCGQRNSIAFCQQPIAVSKLRLHLSQGTDTNYFTVAQNISQVLLCRYSVFLGDKV